MEPRHASMHGDALANHKTHKSTTTKKVHKGYVKNRSTTAESNAEGSVVVVYDYRGTHDDWLGCAVLP